MIRSAAMSSSTSWLVMIGPICVVVVVTGLVATCELSVESLVIMEFTFPVGPRLSEPSEQLQKTTEMVITPWPVA